MREQIGNVKPRRKAFQVSQILLVSNHMTHPLILDQLINEADQARYENKKILVVFDLDSTLFNVTGRTQKIIKELAARPEVQAKFPQEAAILPRVEFTAKDWGLRAPLTRAGFQASSAEFFKHVRDYWHQHFFSNSYLSEDVPYEGAVDFVNELKATGAHIMYLTGRDEPRMGPGTRASLKQWNFPFEEDGCTLVLKPHEGLDDAEFKKDIFLNLADDYSSVWLFENEPVNIHLVAKECPRVQIIYFDSTHSGRAEPPTRHPIIQSYRRVDKSIPKKGKA
jgi:hypothetical protein